MGTKLRGTVIGYGHMGSWHVGHYLKSDVVELAGIYDIDPEKQALARQNGIFSYSSYEAVLADETVDFVLIATPNELHKPLAIAALRAGKHVISEKPVTLSSADLCEIIEAAREAGRLFTVHQNRRWDAEHLMMRQLYKSGDLGEVTRVDSRFNGSRGIPGDWRTEAEHGGGMLYDWGVHLIDQMVGIVCDREIERISCRLYHITNYEVDDGFFMEIAYKDGPIAHIEVATSNFIAMPRFYMTGTNGTALIQNEDRSLCHVARCTQWREEDVKPLITPSGMTRTMAPRDKSTLATYDFPCPRPEIHDFYRNFVRAARGEESAFVTHAQMLYVMRIIEAAFESDRLGLPVAFPYKREFGEYAVPMYQD